MKGIRESSPAALPGLVGAGLAVPIAPAGSVPYCNLDYAASTPPLEAVAAAVAAFLPWYSSVHRGAGFKSRVATAAYDGARESVRRFVGARPDDLVLFTRNTTDSLNLLERALPAELPVVSFAFEHHANLLPWRRRRFVHLPVPSGPEQMLEQVEQHLRREPGPWLVAVTGASNVTGEIPPLAELARLAHRHGARLAVDAAQLAPHRPIDMADTQVDYLVLSGHKLYAPYGSGALIGRADWLDRGDPYLAGGGAVECVTADDVLWKVGTERHEAGSPNVVGAVAMGVACDTLAGVGMDRVAAAETELHHYARGRFLEVPGLELYSTWPFELPHIGVLTFNLEGYEHGRLATILSVEHGIGVRDGCFCAHPLMLGMLQKRKREVTAITIELRAGRHVSLPGAVRASLGLDSTRQHVDRLVTALLDVARNGPRCVYETSAAGDLVPSPDPRTWPDLPFGLGSGLRPGESS
jgi:selenocysteine lyase/cysteine desulfurase